MEYEQNMNKEGKKTPRQTTLPGLIKKNIIKEFFAGSNPAHMKMK